MAQVGQAVEDGGCEVAVARTHAARADDEVVRGGRLAKTRLDHGVVVGEDACIFGVDAECAGGKRDIGAVGVVDAPVGKRASVGRLDELVAAGEDGGPDPRGGRRVSHSRDWRRGRCRLG